MKIVSDVGDPHALVTNAEVAAFLRSRPHTGGGGSALVSRLVQRYIADSPAGPQTVASVLRLRARLLPYRLGEDEFVRVCNLRADCDALLECALAPATLQRLSDDDWEQIKNAIHETLEPRPAEDAMKDVPE